MKLPLSRLTGLERLAAPIVEGEKTFASTSHARFQGESVEELAIRTEGGATIIENLIVHQLKPIWPRSN